MAYSRQSCPKSTDLENGLGIRTLRDVLEAGDTALQAQLFAPENSNSMVALNSAMMTDGVVIEVADGAALSAAPAYRPYRQRCSAGGDVHALVDPCSARPQARPWWKATSARRREGLSGP